MLDMQGQYSAEVEEVSSEECRMDQETILSAFAIPSSIVKKPFPLINLEPHGTSQLDQKRKVKCDRQRPQCGQCVKHYLDAASENCVWPESSQDPEDQEVENQIGSNHGADSGWNHQYSTQSATSHDTELLLQRIVRLESALQRAGASADPSLDYRPWDLGATGLQDSNSAYPYQINGGNAGGTSRAAMGNEIDGLNSIHKEESSLSDSVRFPFSFKPTDSRIIEVLSFLPDVTTTDFLLETYARIEKTHLNAGLSWRLIFMQLEILRDQLAQGSDLTGREAPKIDFSFLSLVFAILASSVEFIQLDELVLRGIAVDEENAVDIMEAWIRISEACLCMANFMAYPNLNILMTLALLRQYHFARSIPTVMTLLAMSIRLAQSLGLHSLGTAKEDEARWITASADENRRAIAERINPITSRPTGSHRSKDIKSRLLSNMNNLCGIASVYNSSGIVDRSHLVRETARRLWAGLVASDYFISFSFGKPQFQIHEHSTGLPLNIDERDLPDHNAINPFVLPEVLPPGAPSECSIYPYTMMIVNVGKEACKMADRQGKLTLEQVTQVDSELRKVLNALPIFLRLDGYSEHLPEVKTQLENRPHLATQRLILHESVFDKINLLHRHFLAKGHRDPQYEDSTSQCVKAAKMVLYCRREIDKIAPDLMNLYVFRIHVFHSVAALCVHLIELARKRINSIEASEIRQEITESLEFLNRSGPRGSKPPPTTSNDIINSLLKAETQMKSNEASSNEEIKNESGSKTLDEILSPDDPLNLYINSLLDPGSENRELSPPDFFDVLDGFMPTSDS